MNADPVLKLRTASLVLDRPVIMGILNVTPDSFSDGGKFLDPARAVEHAMKMAADGADIIDIGGESTRPGSDPVPLEEELRRVVPVMQKMLAVPLSIDTTKPEVAEACLSLGVELLNDVTGLRNPDMMQVAAKHNVPTTIMHTRGEPKTMQDDPVYDDVVAEIAKYLASQALKARKAGVEQVLIDPGIGFGKTTEQNLALIKHLDVFRALGYPVVIGPSRKSHIGKVLGPLDTPPERLEGTLAEVAIAVLNGADIIRVHDVLACRRAAIIAHAIRVAP